MVTNRQFGTTKNGEAVTAYTITNERGISVTVLNYGATLQSVVLPHRGEHVDIVLGYDTIEEYEQNDGYLGASIGRFAGRIPDAVLQIFTEGYPVTANEGKNQLHGGLIGFDKQIWDAETGMDSVTFYLMSPNGDEGFPGTMRISAEYALINDALRLTYTGIAARITAWNPTNHAYWNLNGHDAGDARSHMLEIPADRYMPVRADMTPTNGLRNVKESRYDFRTLRTIGGVYDHCFELNGNPIRLIGERGIGMEITTDCKAVQFYTAKYLGERRGKGGALYGPFGAVCLETQGRQTRRNRPIEEENLLWRDLPKKRITTYRFIETED